MLNGCLNECHIYIAPLKKFGYACTVKAQCKHSHMGREYMQPEEFAKRVNKLTNHQWKLLEVLIKVNGDWITRRKIAGEIGKRRLIPYDMSCLQVLEEKQLVDIQHVQDNTPIGYQVMYRASNQTMVALTQINAQKPADDSLNPT